MATPTNDSRSCASGGAIASGRHLVSPFWGALPPGWTNITPSGQKPPFGILAFSGSAFDSVSGKLYIQGGGHADYGGNEVWEYDIESRVEFVMHHAPDFTDIYNAALTPEEKYAALAPFVDNVNYPGAVMENGLPVRPISRHTYSSLVWLPQLNKFTVGGGSTFSSMTPVNYWDNVWPNSPLDFWFYSPSTQTFEYKGSKLLDPNYKVLSHLQMHKQRNILISGEGTIGNQIQIREYNPETNIWTDHAELSPALNLMNGMLAIDQKRDRLIALLQPSATQIIGVWEYDLTSHIWTEIPTTGTAPTHFYNEPNMQYSEKSDAMWLLRAAEHGLMKLDLTNNTWTTEAISGPAIGSANGNWHYDAKRGIALVCFQDLGLGIQTWVYKE